MAVSLKVAVRLAALLLIAGFVLAGCGSSDSDDDTSSTTGGAKTTTVNGVAVRLNEEAAAQLPAEYKERGLHIVTSAPYAPFEVYDADHELAGLDIDVGNAIAAAFGVEVKWSSIPLEGVIPGLQAHKYDMGLADIGATEARLEALDFVTYFEQGNVLVVPEGNPEGIEGLQSMCGKTLLAESGISLENFVPQTQELCKRHGKAAVDVKALPDQSSVLLGIRSGKGDAGVLSYPAAQALADTPGGEPYEVVVPDGLPAGFVPRYVGAGLAQDTKELEAATKAALEGLLADGVLRELFAKYNLENAVTSEIKVNEAKESIPFPPGTTP